MAPMDMDPQEPTSTSDVEMQDVDAQEPSQGPAAPATQAQPAAGAASDEEDFFQEPFPAKYKAGATYGHAKTVFEHIRDDQILTGCEVLGPFADEEEWELAKWLIKNVGHNQTEAFLKLPIVSDRVRPSFDKKQAFLDTINSLPIGAKWNIEHIPLVGDVLDDDGQFKTETAELWFRDPVECIKELIGNPAFKDVMDYAPKQLFVDKEGKEERINEMSTARWWWEMQQRGDKTAWPVYLTIGNIAKDTRRKASSHATILIGYLPTPKMDCFSDATHSVAKYRLFHYCMGLILKSMADAGTNGVHMTCADGCIHNVHPILAAYVADYPEQCLVACCMENRCPICKVLPGDRGENSVHPKRDVDEILAYIHRFEKEASNAAFKHEFVKVLGLRPVAPFGAGLPHSNIFQAFTPDILHQLHKGVFKDHLVLWCTAVIGEKEMDARFKSMPSHPDVRYFKHGISTVSQWTGSEHKEMKQVFVGLMAGHVKDPAVIKTATAAADFIYLASLESHTTRSLAALNTALDVFHENKQVFVTLEARSQGHFNIPKIHSMQHYAPMIRLFGSADGFNTEAPERLHIDYAKAGYRASNKKDYIAQMTLWLQRQEAVDRFTAYLAWCKDSLRLKPYSIIAPLLLPTVANNETAEITRISPVPAVSAAVLSVAAYKIAKTHPSELRSIPVSVIATPAGINAQLFLPSITKYLRNHALSSNFSPQPFDRFNLYKRITITLPSIREVSDLKLRNVVRASPPVDAVPGTRNNGERAYQDFALICMGEANPVTDGTALEGLRVAQVRVLFDFPVFYPAQSATSKPLAYIEWFTPFSRPEADSDLHRGWCDGPSLDV
ncbi:hypothetical protein B0H17DRAFT_1207991 [Mycena rosella]|uniref:Uncharacterized protein n=1 Tax=Mycena rosella TaxID=1033263 RepID=A0AAD7D261_MYCRO|nr:hypothetical protein B0H17DRAFT_1207991 [Mycena rosella]